MASLKLIYETAEINLTYKNKPDLANRPTIVKSDDAYKVFMHAWDADKIGFVEQAKVLLLNQANRVLGMYELSTGGVAGTVCDPKLVFAAALKANASNIILAHNHPSGSLKPSNADKALTKKLKEAGSLMDIEVLDHLIVTPYGYYSFSDDQTYENEDVAMQKLFEQTRPSVREKNTVALSPETDNVLGKVKNLIALPANPITTAETAYEVLMNAWEDNRLDVAQNFKLLLLDNECRPLQCISLPLGSNYIASIDAQALVALAAKENAQHFVFAQNKSYGVILPNTSDLDFTERLAKEGNAHDVILFDYLFVNKNGYYSYAVNEFHVSDNPRLLKNTII